MFIFPVLIFLKILEVLVFIDVILSWLQIFGLNLRPKFLADIIDPIYNTIKKLIPTSIGGLDFTPIIILLFITFLTGLIEMSFPGSLSYYHSYFN
ncbi:MAG: YggT family protein [Candidatus Gracilibacteria bacterium]|nr:YggT family protein [Candidatus Gracilibacteria bacterium]